MKMVAVSQRVDSCPERGETRDALDQRLTMFIATCSGLPVPVPNALASTASLLRWLNGLQPAAVVLSGGNDLGQCVERDCTEHQLLEYAQARKLPVLGICRGMQMMGVWANGSLVPASGHVHTRHHLNVAVSPSEWPKEVNSFHNFALADCPPGYVVTTRAIDGTIESIRHCVLPWEGWMWHPEREPEFALCDIERFKGLLI